MENQVADEDISELIRLPEPRDSDSVPGPIVRRVDAKVRSTTRILAPTMTASSGTRTSIDNSPDDVEIITPQRKSYTIKIIKQIEESWSILDIVEKNFPPKWKNVVQGRLMNEIKDISQRLIAETYFPLRRNIFRAFELVPPDKVKVVILGQDPYHSTGSNCNPIAQGLSFSVPSTEKIPSSLRNIFSELKNSIDEFSWRNGDLTSWAKQGVFLLNTCLTVRPREPDSHKGIWMGFIVGIFEEIYQHSPNAIYLLWGAKAQSFSKHINPTVVQLCAVHPSGRNGTKFVGCKHFSLTNKILIKKGLKPIDWSIK